MTGHGQWRRLDKGRIFKQAARSGSREPSLASLNFGLHDTEKNKQVHDNSLFAEDSVGVALMIAPQQRR